MSIRRWLIHGEDQKCMLGTGIHAGSCRFASAGFWLSRLGAPKVTVALDRMHLRTSTYTERSGHTVHAKVVCNVQEILIEWRAPVKNVNAMVAGSALWRENAADAFYAPPLVPVKHRYQRQAR